MSIVHSLSPKITRTLRCTFSRWMIRDDWMRRAAKQLITADWLANLSFSLSHSHVCQEPHGWYGLNRNEWMKERKTWKMIIFPPSMLHGEPLKLFKSLSLLSFTLFRSPGAHCFVKLLGVYLQDENLLTLNSSNSIIQINFPIKLFSFLGGVQKRKKVCFLMKLIANLSLSAAHWLLNLILVTNMLNI